MNRAGDMASQVLRLEQRLEAYQKLHAEELAELRQALNECKRAIAALYSEAANGTEGALATAGEHAGNT